MQSLEVISVNIWQIIASLLNLLLLTLLAKKFLFARVQKVVEGRRKAIEDDYARARQERENAEESRLNYEAAMAGAKQAADQLVAEAARNAEHRGNEIVLEAREKASEIRRQAEADALLEKRKAAAEIRHEIADVSAQLTGKLLEREIRPEDHQALIDSFLQEIGTDQ